MAIHKVVRRLTAGRRCIVILGGRLFISTALHGPCDERRPGRIGVGDLALAASVRCRFRRVAAGPLAIDGSRGLDGIGAPGLRERDSVGAYLVLAGLALLAWLVPWRAVAALARACRHCGRQPGIRGGAVTA